MRGVLRRTVVCCVVQEWKKKVNSSLRGGAFWGYNRYNMTTVDSGQ